MNTNLDTLRTEIQSFLASEGFQIFHGCSRALDTIPAVYWDCERYPNYRDFLAIAKAADVKIVVYHEQEFTTDQLDEALEHLETAEMPREESRTIERRLKELRSYEGFTCLLELSFDNEGRVYVFDLRTDWYEELADILDEIEFQANDKEEGDDNPMGGYFSRN